MLSLNDLINPPTRQDVEASIYDIFTTVGVTTTSWKPGAVVRTLVTGVAIVLAAGFNLMALATRGGFLELAAGPWLTALAHNVFGVDREEATFAPGEVTLMNSSGLTFDMDVGDLIVANPTTGKTYRNTEAFTLRPGPNPLTIAILATEAGSASTSAPNSITALETTLQGVACANANAVVGLDEETDPDLRTRCYEKLGSLSPMGPWDAYSFAARNAKRLDGTSVGVRRARLTRDGFGSVTVYVATPSGGVTGDANDPATDLGAVNAAIQNGAVPQAVTALVICAEDVQVSVTYEVWLYDTAGMSDSDVEAAIAAKLVAFFKSQPIGGNFIGVGPGKVFVDAVKTVIGAALPEIFHVVVTLPASDVELAIHEVPVLGTITPVAIHRVASPERQPA